MTVIYITPPDLPFMRYRGAPPPEPPFTLEKLRAWAEEENARAKPLDFDLLLGRN